MPSLQDTSRFVMEAIRSTSSSWPYLVPPSKEACPPVKALLSFPVGKLHLDTSKELRLSSALLCGHN